MDKNPSLTHSFSVSIAAEYGVNEAVLLHNIYFWVKKNEANETHLHDGRYWTYNSYKAFARLFPYFSERQIRYTLDKLKKNGLILTGNYNGNQYDQTKWYALTEKAYSLFGEDTSSCKNTGMKHTADGYDENGDSLCQNCQMEMTTSSDRLAESVKPIPDVNTDGKTSDITPSSSGGTAIPSLDEVIAYFADEGLSIDPRRFYEVNRKRGWVTKSGKPIDDWRKLARIWEKHEGTRTGEHAPSPVPTVEQVMERYACGREVAEDLIRENLW